MDSAATATACFSRLFMSSPWVVAHRRPPRAAGVLPVIAQAPGKVSLALKPDGAAGLVSDRPAGGVPAGVLTCPS